MRVPLFSITFEKDVDAAWHEQDYSYNPQKNSRIQSLDNGEMGKVDAFDFSNFDDVLDCLEKHGITAIFIHPMQLDL